MFLVDGATEKVRLKEKVTTREYVISTLGEPNRSQNGQCDQYYLSKLIQTPEGKYYYEWNLYPPLVFVTLGLIELIVFPMTVIDLGVLSFQNNYLTLSYNETGKLLSYKRSSNGIFDCSI